MGATIIDGRVPGECILSQLSFPPDFSTALSIVASQNGSRVVVSVDLVLFFILEII